MVNVQNVKTNYMICPKCNEEKGCSCQWQVLPELEYKICPNCAEKIRTERLKNDPTTRVIQATTVPIQQRNIQKD